MVAIATRASVQLVQFPGVVSASAICPALFFPCPQNKPWSHGRGGRCCYTGFGMERLEGNRHRYYQ